MSSIVLEVLRNAALAWAKADREADDLAAASERAKDALHMFMVPRRTVPPFGVVAVEPQIAEKHQPEHRKLVAAVETSGAAFTAACARVDAAEESLKGLAEAMLQYEDAHPISAGRFPISDIDPAVWHRIAITALAVPEPDGVVDAEALRVRAGDIHAMSRAIVALVEKLAIAEDTRDRAVRDCNRVIEEKRAADAAKGADG